MNGAFLPFILRRRGCCRRVVVRLRLRLGAIAFRQRPHMVLGRWKGGRCFISSFFVHGRRPRPRARPRPRPRPRRGGLGGLGLDVRVDVRRTEGRPPPSS